MSLSQRKIRFLGAIGLVAALLGGPAARGGETPAVLVIPFGNIRGGASRTNGDRLAEMLRTELKANDMVTVVTSPDEPSTRPSRRAPPPQAKPAPGVARNERVMAEAKNTLADAKDLAKQLKFKQAADAYQSAIQGLESNAAFIDFGDLTDAYLSMAVMQFRAGKEREVEHSLAMLVRLDPNRTLDDKYPPIFQRIFQATRKRMLAQPRGGLKVESTPAGATAFIDGAETGETPTLIKDLVPGAHFIKLVSGGAPVYAAKVDIPSADVARTNAQLRGGAAAEPEPEASPLPTGPVGALVTALGNNVIDEPLLDKATSVAGKAGADFVVLGGVLRKEANLAAAAHLFDVKRQRLCGLMRVSFDAELLGAQLEVYKLANDIAGKVNGCDAESIPAKVTKESADVAVVAEAAPRAGTPETRRVSGGRRPVGAGAASASDDVPATTPKSTSASSESPPPRKATVAKAEPKRSDTEEDVPRRKSADDDDEAEGGVRRVEARETAGELQSSRDVVVPVDEQNKSSGIGKIALVTGIALVAVLALAGGTILIVSEASQPPSGTATIRW